MTQPSEFIDNTWNTSILPTLHDYIRIPNKSPDFDADWQAHGHMRTAVELLSAWVDQSQIQGLSHEIVTLPGRTPTLVCEVAASQGIAADPCVLLYGHYDKQPEFDGWLSDLGPWLPVERDGKLYGRGGADDGYALFASLTAIAELQRENKPHPRCLLLIEGCEESGSYDLPYYVDQLRDRIGTPMLVVCLDAGCGNYEQLWVTNSLRGMLPGTLSVRILQEGQHSGVAGGIVPSSFRILRQLISRIEDEVTGTMHASLQVQIPPEFRAAAQQMAQILGPEIIHQFPWVDGAQPQTEDMAELLLDNCWRPSLAVVGLGGAPAIEDSGNTLRPETRAKLVIRLPPTLDAETASAQIKSILESDPPYGAQVAFTSNTAQTGWCAPPTAAWLQSAIDKASARSFGKPSASMGLGGTIPFMKMLGDAYPQAQFLVTGVLGPHSNAHGPNEFLHIDMAKRLTSATADIIAAAAEELG